MKNKQNIFMLSAFVSFVFYAYIFVALIGSGYFYAGKILLSAALFPVLWIILYAFYEIKDKNFFKISLDKIIIFALGLFLGFYYVKQIWFHGYLNLEPIATLLEGKSHIDTLFHTDISESFITNGYPSIMFNSSSFLHYHTVSHSLLGRISFILNVPTLITYNFLYPIIFIPLYVFLLQTAVIAFRNKFSFEKPSQIKDALFILCICLGFNFFEITDKSCFSYSAIIDSESHLVAVVFMLLYFTLAFLLLDKNKKLDFLISFIFTPFFVFAISCSKISVGLIFYLAIAYYAFRKNPKSIKNWIFIILNGGIFLLSYKFFSDELPGSGQSHFYLFHYIRTYVPKKFWILHYFIYILPAIYLFKYSSKEKFFSKEYFCERNNVWAEMSFLLTIGSWLPGILLQIGAGSAEYFCFPAFIISVLLFMGTNVHCTLYEVLKKKSNLFFCILSVFSLIVIFKIKLSILVLLVLLLLSFGLDFSSIKTSIKNKKYFMTIKNIFNTINLPKISVILFLSASLFLPELKKADIKYTVKETITLSNKTQLEQMPKISSFTNRINKVKVCFGKSFYLEDNLYKTFKEIRKLIKNERSSYCIFIADDCYLYDLYNITNSPQYAMKSVFAAASLYGLPVINAMYSENEKLYRADGLCIFTKGDLYYGLSSVEAYTKRPDFDFAVKTAKENGRNKIIVLTKKDYKIFNVE